MKMWISPIFSCQTVMTFISKLQMSTCWWQSLQSLLALYVGTTTMLLKSWTSCACLLSGKLMNNSAGMVRIFCQLFLVGSCWVTFVTRCCIYILEFTHSPLLFHITCANVMFDSGYTWCFFIFLFQCIHFWYLIFMSPCKTSVNLAWFPVSLVHCNV